MKVWHVPPWKPRMTHSACLGWCFLATMVIMSILIFVTYALGQVLSQDHVFPFKTWEQLSQGTEAWPLAGPMAIRGCPGVDTPIAYTNYTSGAGSNWQVYTDARMFAAAYYPPGAIDGDRPVSVVVGRIKNGQVHVTSNEPYDPAKHTPCGPFQQKSASGGLDGC